MTIYDSLATNIRALETLGVTTDMCATMLFPLVKPHSERSLMTFLGREVESEERIQMAKDCFEHSDSRSTKDKNKKKTRGDRSQSPEIAIAVGLLSLKESKSQHCLFCGENYDSSSCEKARNMRIKLVSSLSTEEFLEAFRRFVARRGRPSIIYSDNGRNFVGAVNLSEKLTGRGSLIKYRQRLKKELRKRFRIQYLGQLSRRTKHKNSSTPVKVGDIILVGNGSQKRLDWPLAIVKEVFLGTDDHIRVVKLKTSKGDVVPLYGTSSESTQDSRNGRMKYYLQCITYIKYLYFHSQVVLLYNHHALLGNRVAI
ncbi:hypothetical protein ALC57_01229 [Trachymyrmex cornetzi]|uniref:DUF5641 domain-containing protein n=1 Tax=Trachymyrmex cornetzi TaxID=471704 RepID=A0A151JQ58_9HYME|nr:hypothetical protein ALC57_01229 [Trachymyrmex cornetzi]